MSVGYGGAAEVHQFLTTGWKSRYQFAPTLKSFEAEMEKSKRLADAGLEAEDAQSDAGPSALSKKAPQIAEPIPAASDVRHR